MALANLALAAFNIIPLPPMDGFRIMSSGHWLSPRAKDMIHILSITVVVVATFLAIYYQPFYRGIL
jgi:Zn-dependent protease